MTTVNTEAAKEAAGMEFIFNDTCTKKQIS